MDRGNDAVDIDVRRPAWPNGDAYILVAAYLVRRWVADSLLRLRSGQPQPNLLDWICRNGRTGRLSHRSRRLPKRSIIPWTDGCRGLLMECGNAIDWLFNQCSKSPLG